MPTETEVKERLTKVFRKVFRDDNIVLFDTITAADVEKWDSLTHLVLIADTEEEFGIRFKLRELTSMKNVGDFIKSVASKAGN